MARNLGRRQQHRLHRDIASHTHPQHPLSQAGHRREHRGRDKSRVEQLDRDNVGHLSAALVERVLDRSRSRVPQQAHPLLGHQQQNICGPVYELQWTPHHRQVEPVRRNQEHFHHTGCAEPGEPLGPLDQRLLPEGAGDQCNRKVQGLDNT